MWKQLSTPSLGIKILLKKKKLKAEGYNITGYIRKSNGKDDTTRVRSLNLMCYLLKERRLMRCWFCTLYVSSSQSSNWKWSGWTRKSIVPTKSGWDMLDKRIGVHYMLLNMLSCVSKNKKYVSGSLGPCRVINKFRGFVRFHQVITNIRY